ncbi:MAG: TOBE domain-containing protein, partial [Pseudomonadota bacterium]
PQEIYDTPANIFVATFMGSPAMNVVPGKVVVKDGRPHADVATDGGMATLPFSQDNLAAWDGREILLGIRPETITDQDGADRKSSNIATFQAPVIVTEPAGSDTFVSTQLGGKGAVARMRSDTAIAAGDNFNFAVNMEKAVAFDPKTEARIAP